MKRENYISKQFTIQFVFIMLLFLTIVILSVMIISLGKNVYTGINNDRTDNYELRVSLSYIANKIRQADQADSIDVKDFKGNPAIVISQTYEGNHYETWIYYYDNCLYEFFADADTQFDYTDGMEILQVEGFSISQIKDNLYKVEVTDKKNNDSVELVLSIYSRNELILN